MIRGRILVIDGDEWLGRMLARVLQEKGFATDFRDDARSGFQRACDTLPDAIVCSIVLPDIDGFWVARRIRTEVGPVAKAPLVLVGDIADKDARIQGLQVGADVLLERPVSNEEIVAQVDALVSMARRFRSETPEAEQSTPSLAAAFRGDLSNFPLASVLMMLEMERRTGSLEVVSGAGKRAALMLSTGLFSSTELGGEPRPALEVLRDVLSWRTGRFAFRPRDVGSIPPPRGSIGALVLEAMRLEDERNNAAS
ncbi:MAG: Response regulator receiver:Transcriptional regulatory protein C-terminal [Labilithrix sp.]|nr:Response regulator receiver:Transcriptional regulatory protein C-terminal [Labilithrix sp.]